MQEKLDREADLKPLVNIYSNKSHWPQTTRREEKLQEASLTYWVKIA